MAPKPKLPVLASDEARLTCGTCGWSVTRRGPQALVECCKIAILHRKQAHAEKRPRK